jgi:hypothetical protein
MKKQGQQGSYNSQSDLRSELVEFRREWVNSFVQELRYEPSELRRWERFAVAETRS